MVWLNAEELTRKFPALEFQSEFAELFGLSMVIRSRFSSPTYTFPDSLGLAIALTDEGKKWFDYIRTKYVESELSTTAIKVGLFTRFCHQDLLIDIDATSAKEIANELSFEIVGGKITYPWVLDRLLYDRFLQHSRTKHRN